MASSLPVPIELLRDPRFRCVWLAGGLTGTVRWLEMLSIGVYTFDLTNSALWVAILMVARMLPMVLFGSIFGAYADRFNRRHLFVLGLACVTCSTTILATLSILGELTLWQIAIGAFLSGTYFSTEFPVRRTLVAEVAGDSRAGTAMALDSATNNATRALGPALGGVIYQSIGLHGTYVFGAVAYAVCLILVLGLTYESQARATTSNVLTQIIEGFQYVRQQPRIMGTLLVTAIINVFGFPFAAMIPVLGRDDLALSPGWIGVLASAEGTGAFVGSLFIAWFARSKHYTRLYIGGALIYLGAIFAFSQSSGFLISWSILIAGGLGIAGFAAMQSAILLTSASPQYRSRVMGALAVCIGTGPVGVLHLGLVAEALGARTAVTIMCLEGILAMVLSARYWLPMWRRG
jgi:MFS family permease